jgi:hypothetical protein
MVSVSVNTNLQNQDADVAHSRKKRREARETESRDTESQRRKTEREANRDARAKEGYTKTQVTLSVMRYAVTDHGAAPSWNDHSSVRRSRMNRTDDWDPGSTRANA